DRAHNLRTRFRRGGGGPASGSSKMNTPWRWRRSSTKSRNSSPCELEGNCVPISGADSCRGSSEKKLSRRKNQPFVILGNQLGRKACASRSPIVGSTRRDELILPASS